MRSCAVRREGNCERNRLKKEKSKTYIYYYSGISPTGFKEVIKTQNWRCCKINPLTPNDYYSGRTVPLTSKRCILYIYSTNIGTEYFKHGINSLFFLFKMQFVSKF